MVEFKLLIPVASNEGVAFSPEHHVAFERVILRRFGGFSLLPGTTSGQWIGDGDKAYADDLRAYVIAAASIFEVAKLKEVVDFALSHYRQEALYVSYLGLSEVVSRAA